MAKYGHLAKYGSSLYIILKRDAREMSKISYVWSRFKKEMQTNMYVSFKLW